MTAVAIFDCTGGIRLKQISQEQRLSNYVRLENSLIMQSSVHEDALTDLSVAKRKETTRSHPEHGRKDFHRRQYSEGSLPGR